MSEDRTDTLTELPARESVSEARGEGWDPGVMEELYELLYGVDAGDRELTRELDALVARHGNTIYAELIYLLSHLRFEPDEARQHWINILAHQQTLGAGERLETDLRVALVSYFIDVARRFKNPKIIELELFERTRASLYRDELTGLHNYRLFREYLDREVQRSERRNSTLSLVMLDVDDFKSYNDRNGHESGNGVLGAIARLLSASIRSVDVAARYGGEEFALILPDTFKTAAYEIAERARAAIECHDFPHGEFQPGGKVTASLGVATFPADATEAEHLVRAADRAMYIAKGEGKNRVQLYGHDRRSFRRIEAGLTGDYGVVGSKRLLLATLNISEGGMLFMGDSPISLESLVECRVELPTTTRRITVAGRVVSLKARDDGRFEMGVRNLEISREDRGHLAHYLREVQG